MFASSSSPRLGADECRPMILGVGGHLPKELFASCHARSRVLTHSPKIVDTTSDLILSGWKHLFHECFSVIIEPTCPRSPLPCQRPDIGAAAGMCMRDGKALFSWMRETGSVAGSLNTPHKNAHLVILTLFMLLVLSHHAGNPQSCINLD